MTARPTAIPAVAINNAGGEAFLIEPSALLDWFLKNRRDRNSESMFLIKEKMKVHTLDRLQVPFAEQIVHAGGRAC